MSSIARKGRLPKKAQKVVELFTESLSFDQRLYKYDIEGSIAHVEMLGKCNIIKLSEQNKIVKALRGIRRDIERGVILFDRSVGEDIHEFVENTLKSRIGEELGAKLHTARSRNDQIALDMRLYLRTEIKEIIKGISAINGTILKLVEKNEYVLMPAYTHMQYAKPIYFRDYIRAYFYSFMRDIERLEDCLKRVNQMPLGAGAVGGVHWKIDRDMVRKRLGFDTLMINKVDAVSDRDFIMEFLSISSIIMVHFSRLSEELVLWVSPQFNFMKIDDSFCSGSSILPQKKNPDVPELIRGKTGRVFGNMIGMFTVMKALPMAYNRDMQEDKVHLFSTVTTIKNIVGIVNQMLKPHNLRLNVKTMLQAARDGDGFVGASLYADKLAKDIGFRKAHEVVGRLVHYLASKGKKLEDLRGEDHAELLTIFDEDTIRYLEMIAGRLDAEKSKGKKQKK